MHPALIAVAIWGTGLVFALSLYGLQALTVGAHRLQQKMEANRTHLRLSRGQPQRRPLGPVRLPSRNGHKWMSRASYSRSLDPRRGLR